MATIITYKQALEDIWNWEQDANELCAWTFDEMQKELDDIFGYHVEAETVQNYLDAAHDFGTELSDAE